MRSPFMAAAAVVFCVGFALAHAILVGSSPEANSIVDGPNIKIILTFNVRIDAKRSFIRLVNADGAARSLPLLTGDAPNVLLASANNVRPGRYKLSWQVLASDGHITRGEVPFSAR